MIDQNNSMTHGRDRARDLADLRAEFERLRRDLGDLGGTMRTLAKHEWDTTRACLRTAAAERKTRFLGKIAVPPERLTGIAFCIGVAAGLLLRARRNT
ncbi:MAG: hypothetical protein ACYCZX_16255 [Rhodospirillaceae bacterium]